MDNESKATTDSENNASGRQSRSRTRAEGGFHMRQDSFPRLVSGTGSGGHGQSTGRSNSRGRSGSRDRLSCKGPSSSQGRSSSRGRSGSRGRSSSRGHSSSRKRSASRGRDNTGNKWNIGARPKIEGRSECHQQGSTPPTDKTNVPDDHKRVSFVDKVSHTHPPGGSEDILQLKRMVEKLTGAVTALQNENAELRKQLTLKIQIDRKRQEAEKPPHNTQESTMVVEKSLPSPSKRKSLEGAQPEITLEEVCHKLETDIQTQIQALDTKIQAQFQALETNMQNQIQSILSAIQGLTDVTQGHRNELLAINIWQQTVEHTIQQIQHGHIHKE
ncbi:hypothetical protein V5799_029525 [Amblyomma americanum]|uniref:Uncharacterized protein n=1 Tax=Amblyomma americanum TaxID=6943 RepID=A0AAQ4EQY3_AMBAM